MTQHHQRIADASRTIFSYCLARTSSRQDAEDLSQEILLQLTRSLPNLRDEKAFYGFMWSVAHHTVVQWRRKHAAAPQQLPLDEAAAALPAPVEEDGTDVALLRRELALLHRDHRRAALLYYMDGLSCAQVAQRMEISVSMVKYLLFKARIKLKEGMQMERNYGQLSYQPRRLLLGYWGQNSRCIEAGRTLIAQNILAACYNDSLTPEEISLEIGVALPYLEDDLNRLVENGLLRQEGRRYVTAIVLFTREFLRQAQEKAAPIQRRIADLTRAAVAEQEQAIRALGFFGSDMDQAAFAWQITCILLHTAITDKAQDAVPLHYPTDVYGVPGFIWGEENADDVQDDFTFGASNFYNPRGDHLQFMDMGNKPMLHHAFWAQPGLSTVLLDIARNVMPASSSDLDLTEKLMSRRCVRKEGERFLPNMPVFTGAQLHALMALLDAPANEIAQLSLELLKTTSAVLMDHTPARLQQQAGEIAFFRLFEDAITAPIRLLHQDGFLADSSEGLLPTTYIVLTE